MNFAIVCTLVFLALIVLGNLGKIHKYVMVAMLAYSIYVIAANLGVTQDLVPKELDPVLNWATNMWNNVRGL